MVNSAGYARRPDTEPAGAPAEGGQPHGVRSEPSAPARPPADADGGGAVFVSPLEAELLRLAGSVPDPELPVVTLGELGVVRDVRIFTSTRVEVELTPTYTGCPALGAMSAEIERILQEHGIPEVSVRTVLSPPWSTDDITPEGRRKLAEFGIAPPRPGARCHPVREAEGGSGSQEDESGSAERPLPVDRAVPLELAIHCPRCGSTDTTLLSRFSSTACKALRRCASCLEPFDHFKEV